MRFDLFFELSLPPGLGLAEPQLYAEALAQVELADALGYGCAWFVEHHFLRRYSHCSKPELVLAAAAARTRAIRLGHAVIPLPLHHPVHVAERVATLDILSGGRLEVGVGRGFSPREYEAFGAAMPASRELADEALAVLRASFTRRPVTFRGRHYRLEELDILPHVVQQPHPPLWTAAVSPATFSWAAARGLGVLAGPFKPWFMLRRDIARYRAEWRGAEPPRVGMTLGVLCLEDRHRARAAARRAFGWFYGELLRATAPVLERLYPSYEELHELGRFRALARLGADFTLLETFGLAVAGDPEDCRGALARFAAGGVTHLLCAFGAGAVEPALVRESMALFAREVAPAFAAAAARPQPALGPRP